MIVKASKSFSFNRKWGQAWDNFLVIWVLNEKQTCKKKESLLALWRELKVKKIFQFPSFSINLMWKDKKKLKSIFARHQSKVTLANGFFALELFFSLSHVIFDLFISFSNSFQFLFNFIFIGHFWSRVCLVASSYPWTFFSSSFIHWKLLGNFIYSSAFSHFALLSLPTTCLYNFYFSLTLSCLRAHKFLIL